MTRILIIAVLISILQLTAVAYTKIIPPFFNLPLIFLVFFSLRKGLLVGIALGIFFGFVNGIFGLSNFWLDIFLYTAIGFLVGYIGQWFYKENILTFLLMVFCSLLFVYFAHFISRQILPMQLSIPEYIFRLILPAAGCNITASIFLFYFFKELKL